MATRYPGALDRDPNELPDNIADSDTLDSPNHATVHNNVNGAVLQIEEKLGIGDTTASVGAVLHGTAAGESEWTSDPSIVGSLSVAKDSADAVINLTAHHDTEATAAELTLRKSDGSKASPALVDDDAVLGKIMFQGYDGNSYANGAQIRAQVDGTPADGDMPTEMIFMVTPDGGSETPATALTLSPDKKATFAGEVHVDGSLIRTTQDGANAAVEIMSHSDTETVTPELRFYKSDNTNASPALVDDDAILGRVEFKGYDGDSYADGASIIARIDGTPSGSSMPTELDFRTTPVGSQTPASNMVIKPDGKVGIGDSTPLHTLEIHSDDDLTSFTGTNKGAVKICNSDYTSGDITALDFGYSGSNNPIGRIGLEITGSGSELHFGTSGSYASGITNDAFMINSDGRVGFRDDAAAGVLTNRLVTMRSQTASMTAMIAWAEYDVSAANGTAGIFMLGDTSDSTNPDTGDYWILFRRGNGTTIGSVRGTGSASVNYLTTSDQTMKNDLGDAGDVGSLIDALKIHKYTWKDAKAEVGEQFGVFAQEVLDISGMPYGIATPSETRKEENQEGVEEDVYYPAGIDYGKLVPLLVQEIKSLRQRVATLEG